MRYVFDSFVLDGATRELVAAGTPVRIEPKVLDLILHLIGARDRVVSKDELVEAVWQGRIISDEEIKGELASHHPYREWLDRTQLILEDLKPVEPRALRREPESVS